MKQELPKSAIIIGAGLAGIAASIRLRSQGFQVIVLEKNSTHGGKLAEFSEGEFRFDKGPSLFTSPELVDELFELCGKNPRDYFNYVRHETSCTYFFKDKSSLIFSGNHEKLKQELTKKFTSELAYKTLTYLERSKETYARIGDFFIDNPPVKFKDVFRKDLIVRYPHFLTAKLRKSLHQYNHSTLKEPKLVQIFDRFGTYNGSNPFKMSGLYSMIPHLEGNTGTYFPVNGMRSIAESLYQLAVDQGVEFKFDADIESVKFSAEKYFVKTASEQLQSSYLICAIDHVKFYRDILKDEKLLNHYSKQERSSSAVVFYWGIKSKMPELGLHSIFFSQDYRNEFEQIFTKKIIPEDPTIYVHVSSVVNAKDAPENGQNWFVMVNTPAGVVPTENQISDLKEIILARIKMQFEIDLKNEIVRERIWTSKGIEEDTGSFMGALYGASSNGKLAALKRHGNKSKKYPKLYFCGGTVHPGGGIPLVLKSAKIVSELIQHES
ncbi:MAG: phytoene desaturase [Crocinitomicaceae bacterium]|nr:phytoene desaturase [Crocinitomicaceae bacterium]